ncbi:hypothetical protein [Desulfatitalea alkaliphila]|uniref:Uncharacterized protein n=1 Tax=Desulfatitalea alkaliphila TaxID=2929485 RepID=A0AA41UIB1_9BACT|nr:hypothetical protein [Desulfatitalea alkaliphila]MCJ8499889.1 hypothetical protein [Desulfatitalea alkaliphila]
MTDINDIVLIYLDEKPLSFARVEAIEPDIKRDWYHVKLLLLQVPLQVVTWILRDVYINGETFTMDGKPLRLERVVSPEPTASEKPAIPPSTDADNAPPQNGSPRSNVIALHDLKKKS